MKHQIVPNLWFDGNAEEAADFYVSVFPDSKILNVSRYTESGPGPEGTAMVVEWQMNGQRFMGINGGPQFTFDEAISFLIECDDQDEIDAYWDALLAGGGTESQCGWLRDRFGLSWQVVPTGMEELFASDDKAAVDRAMKAMMGMVKLDIAALKAAAAGEPVA